MTRLALALSVWLVLGACVSPVLTSLPETMGDGAIIIVPLAEGALPAQLPGEVVGPNTHLAYDLSDGGRLLALYFHESPAALTLPAGPISLSLGGDDERTLRALEPLVFSARGKRFEPAAAEDLAEYALPSFSWNTCAASGGCARARAAADPECPDLDPGLPPASLCVFEGCGAPAIDPPELPRLPQALDSGFGPWVARPEWAREGLTPLGPQVPAAVSCGPGTAQFAGSSSCAPIRACTDVWPSPAASPALYVSPSAVLGGDGSINRPFASIDEAIAARSPTGQAIFLSPGEHRVDSLDVDELDLRGTCAGPSGTLLRSDVELTLTGRATTLRDLTLSVPGLSATFARPLTLTAIEIESHERANSALEASGDLNLGRVLIRSEGPALSLSDATAQIDELVVDGADGPSVAFRHSQARGAGWAIRHTREGSTAAALLLDNADVLIERVLIEKSALAAVFISSSTATISDLITRESGSQDFLIGEGVLSLSSTISLQRVQLEAATSYGLSAFAGRTRLEDAVIVGTRAKDALVSNHAILCEACGLSATRLLVVHDGSSALQLNAGKVVFEDLMAITDPNVGVRGLSVLSEVAPAELEMRRAYFDGYRDAAIHLEGNIRFTGSDLILRMVDGRGLHVDNTRTKVERFEVSGARRGIEVRATGPAAGRCRTSVFDQVRIQVPDVDQSVGLDTGPYTATFENFVIEGGQAQAATMGIQVRFGELLPDAVPQARNGRISGVGTGLEVSLPEQARWMVQGVAIEAEVPVVVAPP